MSAPGSTAIEIGLTAAIVAAEANEPTILVAGHASDGEPRAGLPSGPFDPHEHRTFEMGLRAWVEDQTGLRVGYVEQLYTFGDRGRQAETHADRPHRVSVGYLALTRMPDGTFACRRRVLALSLVPFLSWEDWRSGRPISTMPSYRCC